MQASILARRASICFYPQYLRIEADFLKSFKQLCCLGIVIYCSLFIAEKILGHLANFANIYLLAQVLVYLRVRDFVFKQGGACSLVIGVLYKLVHNLLHLDHECKKTCSSYKVHALGHMLLDLPMCFISLKDKGIGLVMGKT